MAIAPTVGELVPGWVYQDWFPEADETALGRLAEAWSSQAEANTAHAEELSHAMKALGDTYSGPAARAASAAAKKTHTWLETGAKSCTSLGKTCTTASVLVTATKTAMNVVLLSLQVSTQKILQAEGGNVLDVAGKLIKIRQVQIAAQAQVEALSRALVTKLGELKPEVEIRPELPKPKTLLIPGLDNLAVPVGTGGPTAGSGGADGTGEFPDVGAIVGTDDSTQQLADNGLTPGASPGVGTPDEDGLADASHSALSEEEREQLYQEALGTLEGDGTDGYGEEGLYDDAEQVDPDAIPETVHDEQVGSGQDGSDPDGLTPEQILGEDPTERPDPTVPNEEFEGPGPGPGVDDGPPPPLFDNPDQDPGADPGTEPPAESRPDPGQREPDPTPSRPEPTYRPDPPYRPEPTPSTETPWNPPPPRTEAPVVQAPTSPDVGGGHHGGSSSDGPAPIESRPVTPPEQPGTSGAGVAPPAPVGTNPGTGVPAGPGSPLGPGGSGLGNPGPGGGPGGSAPGGSGLGGSGMGGSGLGGSGLGGTSSLGSSGVGGIAGSSTPGTGSMGPAPSNVPPSGSVPTTPQPSSSQPGTVPPQASQPHPSQSTANQPGPNPQTSNQSPTQPVPPKDARVPEPRPPLSSGDPAQPTGPDRTDALGALIGAGLMASGLGLAALWADLGRPTPGTGPAPSGERYLPTQFGREDVLLAALPAGMSEVYQRALVPGEAEAFLSGMITTLRGIIHPYDQISDLQTPAALHDALGLGFGVLTGSGSSERAFDRNADQVEVIRFNGIRPDDLVVPVAADVVPPADTTIPYVVRQHGAPWTGSGEAPGSTVDHPIEEYEILGTASVAIPHLAEIWRIGADGTEQHVATFNARAGVWTGMPAPEAPTGRVVENGLYAQMPDGMTYQVVTLTDQEHVLIARGLTAPEYFLPAADGSARWIASTDELVALLGVTSLAVWRGATVQLLRRDGGHCLVDYAGTAPAQAAALGFHQLNQGQWAPQWVSYAELTAQQEVERPISLPEPAEEWADVLSGRPAAPPPAPRPTATG